MEVTDYDTWTYACMEYAHQPKPTAIDFSNTHIVAMRRHDPSFRESTQSYDHFVPDGMPLIWCLNAQGVKMRDRVYGPTFFKHFLTHATEPFTHYLAGGTEEAGKRLRTAIPGWNARQTVVGAFHGRCLPDGRIHPDEEPAFLEEIERLNPDFIWLCFGAPKQQLWVSQYKQRLRRGVILSVGFAFDVHAGTKQDAPMWMQKRGLTWIYRMASEPKRLISRYLKYNSLFLFYLAWDGLRGKAFRTRF